MSNDPRLARVVLDDASLLLAQNAAQSDHHMRYFSVSIIGSIFYFELENAVFGDLKKKKNVVDEKWEHFNERQSLAHLHRLRSLHRIPLD